MISVGEENQPGNGLAGALKDLAGDGAPKVGASAKRSRCRESMEKGAGRFLGRWSGERPRFGGEAEGGHSKPGAELLEPAALEGAMGEVQAGEDPGFPGLQAKRSSLALDLRAGPVGVGEGKALRNIDPEEHFAGLADGFPLAEDRLTQEKDEAGHHRQPQPQERSSLRRRDQFLVSPVKGNDKRRRDPQRQEDDGPGNQASGQLRQSSTGKSPDRKRGLLQLPPGRRKGTARAMHQCLGRGASKARSGPKC